MPHSVFFRIALREGIMDCVQEVCRCHKMVDPVTTVAVGSLLFFVRVDDLV